MANKAAVSVIGGADGPTSVFLCGSSRKISLKQRLQKYSFNIRKRWIEKHVKAGAHSESEVESYIQDFYGFTEIARGRGEYQEEYRQMRAAFIQQYAPQLMGEYASYPQLEGRDAGSIQKFMEELKLRQKAAENVPRELFDIDLHIFEKNEADIRMRLTIEWKYQYIGGSCSGSKFKMKKYKKIYRNVYRYYGVSQEDIDKKTKRYEELVKTLAMKAN